MEGVYRGCGYLQVSSDSETSVEWESLDLGCLDEVSGGCLAIV